jgi:hypothetical protein
MRPTIILAAAAPLVLAAPRPEPLPLPNPQGVVTNPITGLVGGLIEGVVTIGSLESAVPAIISDVGDLLDATGTVTGELFPISRFQDSILIEQ